MYRRCNSTARKSLVSKGFRAFLPASLKRPWRTGIVPGRRVSVGKIPGRSGARRAGPHVQFVWPLASEPKACIALDAGFDPL